MTQYRVFIGTPGGLEEERKLFRCALESFTQTHSEPRSVLFHPVGWEDTIGGVGRPQELINDDLRQCDYAVFVLHDRWGSPTGNGNTSGVEEEWALAEKLYKDNKIRNIALFFKAIDPHQQRDPGPQLQQVLAFKKQIEAGKKYLFCQYDVPDEYSTRLGRHLAKWLRDHEGAATGASSGLIGGGHAMMDTPGGVPKPVRPGFDYWIAEAESLSKAENPDHNAVLFCSLKARDAAGSDIEWARAVIAKGISQCALGRSGEAISDFELISERFSGAADPALRACGSKALFNKGVVLGALDRRMEAIAVYDDLLACAGTASELTLRETVAKALFNKAGTLITLNRGTDSIAVYDDLEARFGTANEAPLREAVAKALYNKGIALSALGRRTEAMTVYEDLLARFGTASELSLRELVAMALFNKGGILEALARGTEAIAVYDDLLVRLGPARELTLREQIAKTLFNKGATLGALDHRVEAIAVYDDLLARFGAASELTLRELVAKTLFNKAASLAEIDRRAAAIAACDELLTRFGTASELPLREAAAKAKSLANTLRGS